MSIWIIGLILAGVFGIGFWFGRNPAKAEQEISDSLKAAEERAKAALKKD